MSIVDGVPDGVRDGVRDLARWLRLADVYGPATLDDDSVADIRSAVADDLTLYALRPSRVRDRSGIDTTLKLWHGYHETIDGRAAFEIRHSPDDQTRFFVAVPEAARDQFEELVAAFFPRSELAETGEWLLELSTGRSIAGARVGLRADYLLPILNPLGVSVMDEEPYNRVIGAMEDAPADTESVVQVAFEPAPDHWWERSVTPVRPRPGSGLSPLRTTTLSCENVAGTLGRSVGDEARHVVAGQRDENAFVASIRVLATGATTDHATEAAARVASTFDEAFTEPAFDQGLRSRGLSAPATIAEVARFAGRRVCRRRQRLGVHKRDPCIVTVPELTALAHVPSCLSYEAYRLEAPSVDWVDGDEDEDEGDELTDEDFRAFEL